MFTTRADTLFGATFMSLAPEHPLALALAQGTGQEEAVGNFVEYWRAQNRSRGVLEEVTKEGVFTGSFCIEPRHRLARCPFMWPISCSWSTAPAR